MHWIHIFISALPPQRPMVDSSGGDCAVLTSSAISTKRDDKDLISFSTFSAFHPDKSRAISILTLLPSCRAAAISYHSGLRSSIMRCSFRIFNKRTTLIISLVGLVVSNADRSSWNDESLFTDSLLDQSGVVPVAAPASVSLSYPAEGIGISYLDGDPLLFDETDDTSNDSIDIDAVSDSKLEVAACSSSDLFSANGKKKSRLRRLGGPPEACQNPATGMASPSADADAGAEPPDLSSLRNVFQDTDTLRLLDEITGSKQDFHASCYLYTRGVLPWGVCPLGDPNDRVPLNNDQMGPPWNTLNKWLLYDVTVSKWGLIPSSKKLSK